MRDRGKDVGPPPHRCATVSICNIYRPFLAPDVTDRDELFSGTRLSQSVTSTRQIELYLLQIETNRRHPNRKSKSVTPGPLLAAKMLQVETNREPPQRCLSPLWWSREESAPIKRGDIKPSLRLAIPRSNENTATKSRTDNSPFAQIEAEIQGQSPA